MLFIYVLNFWEVRIMIRRVFFDVIIYRDSFVRRWIKKMVLKKGGLC